MKQKNIQSKTVGILLAGGMSRRFGQPKAFYRWMGKPFFHYAYEALDTICDEIIIATRPEFIADFPDSYLMTTDVKAYDGCGPLAGIYTGMKQRPATTYVVLPCDMPLIDSEIMTALFQEHRSPVTAVEISGEIQPLVSVWDAACMGVIQTSLDNQEYAMKKMLEKIPVHPITYTDLAKDATSFMNINTTKALKTCGNKSKGKYK